MYVFILLLRTSRKRHKVNFKMNSQVWVSFYSAGFNTKFKEPGRALLFIHNSGENDWIHTFPKGISAMWNANSRNHDLNTVRRNAESISNNDNHYTIYVYIYIYN